jgi:KaiC/GvpD/RAD55 family RecA-like ATPase
MFSGRQGEKIETRIPGFDEITGGGLLRSSAILFIGEANGWKELLVRQICWNALVDGGRVLYCTVDQPTDDIRQSMARRGWTVVNHENAGRLRFVDVYSSVSASKTGSDSGNSLLTDGFYAQTALNMFSNDGMRFFPGGGSSRTQVAVIDSLSPLLSVKGVETLQLLNLLRDATRIARVTGIGTIHSDILGVKNDQTVKTYADGIIRLTMMSQIDNDTKGLIEIVKYAGQYKMGHYPVKVDEKGFSVLAGQ